MMTRTNTHRAYTMEQSSYRTLRIVRRQLTEAIERAFVESRFSEPPRPMHVCIHTSGKMYVSQMALHASSEGFNEFSLECNGTPERPLHGAVVQNTWSRSEYADWVRSRPDLYAAPVIERLLHNADRKNMRVLLAE